MRPPSSSTRWNACGPSPRAHTRPERRVRVHPLAGCRARQQLQEDLQVAPARDHLLDPHHRDQHVRRASCTSGRCPRTRRRRRCPFRRPRSWRRRSPPCARRNAVAQVEPRGLGELGRVVRELGPPERSHGRGRGSRVRFLWIAGTRRCDGRSPASWMISSARSVSIARTPAARERVVEPDLVGRQRLDLHDLVAHPRRGRAASRSRSPPRRRAPSARRRRAACTDASSSSRYSSSRAKRPVLDRRARVAELPPSPAPRRRPPPAVARIVSCACRTFARVLGVGERRTVARALERLAAPERHARGDRLIGGQDLRQVHRAATLGAATRSPPPMCIRHEASHAHTAPAPVASDGARASRPASRSTPSAFLTANVPAEAAALLGAGSGTSSSAGRQRAAAAAGASPTPEHAQRVTGRVVGDGRPDEAPAASSRPAGRRGTATAPRFDRATPRPTCMPRRAPTHEAEGVTIAS